MPLCPQCKTEQDRRVRGKCPSCGTEVSAHKGQWYRSEIGSPTLGILHAFEDHMSRRMSTDAKKVDFRIPQKSSTYKRELVAIERLLGLCDHDYDLVIETLDLMFTHPKFSRKNYTSLLWVEPIFLQAMAIAKADREVVEKKVSVEDHYAKQVASNPKLFDY